MQKIQSKGALVFLQLVVVLVLGKILGLGEEFVADVVPAFQGLLGSGTCGTGASFWDWAGLKTLVPTMATRVIANSASEESFEDGFIVNFSLDWN